MAGNRPDESPDDSTLDTVTQSGDRPVVAPLANCTGLDRYTIVDQIGSGGMGEVYLAHDGQLDRKVALKLLRPDAIDTDAQSHQARLSREAQAMAKLSHPNVVAVYDIGASSERVFIAMEYVEGRTLRRWLSEAPRSWREATRVLMEAGRGLAAAHSAQLLHRDFKPENVLVGKDGRVRVLDFGLACEQFTEPVAPPGDELNTHRSGSTERNAIVGTPGYMAPEQLLGQEIDARADQYSFCVALYEALYGERPFDGASGRLKPARADKEVPHQLRSIMLRGLRISPHERYPSMHALLFELSRAQGVSQDRDSPACNLEAPATWFVGRSSELERVSALLRRSDSRLITLLGPGGVGKTRLAIEAASHHLDEFSGNRGSGVWFCDLSDATTLEALLSAMAGVLHVHLSVGKSHKEGVAQLGHALAARGPVLLILDNFEQVVELAPATVGTWMSMAPLARFLVTSRELLCVPGEVRLDVASLPLPAPERGIASILASDSVRLFVERVRAVRGWSYTPSDADIANIAKIVRHLDGIPLGIELAAGRLSSLGLETMAERISRPLQLLTSGKTGARARQATLRGAIQWSWDLLSPSEQETLMQCAIFRGGFTLEAAEAVVSGLPNSPPVLDLVQALQQKSLLRTYPNPESDELRFGMYETIREFVAEQLARSEKAAGVGARHTRYFLSIADGWRKALRGRGGLQALRALTAEMENLSSAFERACSQSPAAQESVAVALQFALAMDPALAIHGPWQRHQEILDRCLELSAAVPVDPLLRAQVLRARGQLSHERDQIDAALRDFEEARTIAAARGEQILEGTLLVDLAVIHRERLRMSESEQALRSAMQTASKDPWLEAYVQGNIGILDYELGRYREAQLAFEKALERFREIGDRRYEAFFVCNLGVLCRDQGRLNEARSLYEKGVPILHELGDRRYEGTGLDYLAGVLWEQQLLQEARAVCKKALTMVREAGDRRQSAISLAHLAGIHASLGSIPQASDALAQVEALLAELKDPVVAAELTLSQAHLDLANYREAVRDQRLDLMRQLTEKLRARIDSIGPDLVAKSIDARLAVRNLRASVEAAGLPFLAPASRG